MLLKHIPLEEIPNSQDHTGKVEQTRKSGIFRFQNFTEKLQSVWYLDESAHADQWTGAGDSE